MSSGWLVVQELMEERARLNKWSAAGSTLSDHQRAMLAVLCETDQADLLLKMFTNFLRTGQDA